MSAAPTEKPTVQEAWSEVMGAVQSIAKRDRNEAQRFVFRGIDAVMNAVGPALREHHVTVVPVSVDRQMRDTQTTSGKATRECLVMVTYRVTGPAGDYFDGVAPGEALDSSDKSCSKAMSVAYRTFLLQALTVPTDEPDPDLSTHERAPQARQTRARPESAPEHTQPTAGAAGTPLKATTRARMFALFTELGITDEKVQRGGMATILGHPVTSRGAVTDEEAKAVIASLEARKGTS